MVHFYFTARKNDFDQLLTAAASFWHMAAEVHLFWPTMHDQALRDCPRALPQKSDVASTEENYYTDCSSVGCEDTVYVLIYTWKHVFVCELLLLCDISLQSLGN